MRKSRKLSPEREEEKAKAEADLEYFITLMHPKRLLGNIHREVIRWWTAGDAKSYQLLLLPRDHMKSALIAYRAVWELTKDPTLRILYISSTSNLAIKQLKFIKDILTSDKYRLYWPEMVLKEEAKREQWTQKEISVDHPRRKEESIRDPSIFTAGLTTNITGMHCDIAILDDVVVASNAYVEDARDKVLDQYGALASIEGTNPREWLVGTRYHPRDLYQHIIGLENHIHDEFGGIVKSEPLFDVKEEQVETAGDGSGEFLWPRQQRYDGQWFGFDRKILADKWEKYPNKLHFRAQYYNNPNDIESSPISRSLFQYYDPGHLTLQSGRWYFGKERLNVFASVDFAYTLGKKSDSTAIVVVGIDGQRNYYILEIERFKTNKHSEYYERILKLHQKWGFNKLRAEVVGGQISIVNDLRDNYIRRNGLSLSIVEAHPTRWQGNKDERILAILQPKYDNRQIWHYPSGNCQILEEELILQHPPHDDVKDALASAIDFAVAPLDIFNRQRKDSNEFTYHSRWGGVA